MNYYFSFCSPLANKATNCKSTTMATEYSSATVCNVLAGGDPSDASYDY